MRFVRTKLRREAREIANGMSLSEISFVEATLQRFYTKRLVYYLREKKGSRIKVLRSNKLSRKIAHRITNEKFASK